MEFKPLDQDERIPPKKGVYVEDLLILICLVPLFILGVFFRDRWWAQAGLGLVLIVMAAVLVRRVRRVHRAFTDPEEYP
jgi:hypothetical protein